MRSCRYESKTDNITGSVENEEKIMYKHKNLNLTSNVETVLSHATEKQYQV